MRLCSKVLVGILAIAAIIAIIAGLFVGVRRHIGNSNIDPATLVSPLAVSWMSFMQATFFTEIVYSSYVAQQLGACCILRNNHSTG